MLYLVLNIWNQERNKEVCIASFLSSNGYILAHFDNIHLKFPTHAYFEVSFHLMLSKYENSKNRFYDVVTNELLLLILVDFRGYHHFYIV